MNDKRYKVKTDLWGEALVVSDSLEKAVEIYVGHFACPVQTVIWVNGRLVAEIGLNSTGKTILFETSVIGG